MSRGAFAFTLPSRQLASQHYLIHTTRIIEPLASRCSKFRFTPLDSTSTSARLIHIAKAERVPLHNLDSNSDEGDNAVISTLISTSAGDLRRAITYLQSASRLASSTDPPTPITPTDIQEIAGVVPEDVVRDFAAVLGVESVRGVREDMEVDDGVGTVGRGRAKGFEGIKKKVKELMREGYSASQILLQVSLTLSSKCQLLTFIYHTA
jgi:replication factor C subunit 2/4